MKSVDKPFAAFDIDGTIARTSLFLLTVHEMMKRSMLDQNSDRKLMKLYADWRNRKTTGAFEVYEEAAVNIVIKEIANIKVSAYEAILDAVIDRAGDETYRYPVQLISELKAKGYTLIAISGSESRAVGRFCRKHGFDDWIGTDYHNDGIYFTGSIDNASIKKASHLRDLIAKHKLSRQGSFAVGDTNSDIAMLEMVENPICFNPNRQLKNHASAAGWPIIIERKNVIYKLKPKNGDFVLEK